MNVIEQDPFFAITLVLAVLGASSPGLYLLLLSFMARGYSPRGRAFLRKWFVSYGSIAIVTVLSSLYVVVATMLVHRIDTYLLALQVMGIHCKP